ncbi:MAG: hypothetical protein LW865_01870 [Betaproteobacteria bacterium]|jgi:hypothetical protein|nr:hypothetical protein [Betaproteobacteria bacterium]
MSTNPVPSNRPSTFATAASAPRKSLSVGGKIRGGIMVLTATAKKNPKAVEIYDAGVKAGLRFRDIGYAIEKHAGLKNALVPKNMPYFFVRGGDFHDPSVADKIMELYADKKDGRLYRFPVVFVSDSPDQVMPQGLAVWTGAEKKYWQEIGINGVAHCKTRVMPKLESGAVPIRLYRGRDIIDRPDNGGLCKPLECKEYQSRACNNDGALVFHIKGVSSVRPFVIPTKSFYSREDVTDVLTKVASIKGTVTGQVHNGGYFWISKKTRIVTQIVDGKPVKSEQHLIWLDADVDVGQMVIDQQNLSLAAAQAANAAAILSGLPQTLADDDAPAGEPTAAAEAGADAPNATDNTATPAAEPDLEAAAIEAAMKVLAKDLRATTIPSQVFTKEARHRWGDKWRFDGKCIDAAHALLNELAAIHKEIATVLTHMTLEQNDFEFYAARRFGDHWKADVNALVALLEEVCEAKASPDAYKKTIKDFVS